MEKRRLIALLALLMMMALLINIAAVTGFADTRRVIISDPLSADIDVKDLIGPPIGPLPDTDGPSLRMDISVDAASARSGDILAYALKVTNVGGAAAVNVAVSCALPSRLANIGNFAVNGVPVDDPAHSAAGFELAIGDIMPSALKTVTFEATANESGAITQPIELTVTAVARENRPDDEGEIENAVSNEGAATTMLVAPNLEITKTVLSGGMKAYKNQLVLGDVIAYTLTVTNYRAEKSREIVVTDVLPDRLELLDRSGAGLSPSIGTANYDADRRTITWTIPGGLDAAGSVWGTRSASLSFDARPTEVGVYQNRATMTENGEEKSSNETESTVSLSIEPGDVITIPVSKDWVGDAQEMRPASIDVALLANGQVVAGRTLTLSAPIWRGEFASVPLNDPVTGLPVTYSVAELTDVAALGYESTVVGTAITNTQTTDNPESYALTIHYWNGELGGEKIAPDYTRTLLSGTVYNVASPLVTGYTADVNRIVGVMEDEDVEYDVVYSLTDYTLTIHYRYAATGEVAAKKVQKTLNMGDRYSVSTPTIAGYNASKAKIAGTMPARDLTYTVNFYAPEDIIINVDEYGVPLGIGTVMMNIGDCFE